MYGQDRVLDGKTTIQNFLYRKNLVIETLEKAVLVNFKLHGVDLFNGTASFEDANTIIISGDDGVKRITGDYILIATGSYPFQPPDIPFDGIIVHDSDSILDIMHIHCALSVPASSVVNTQQSSAPWVQRYI
jgi:NAD(P) transhydrogenase